MDLSLELEVGLKVDGHVQERGLDKPIDNVLDHLDRDPVLAEQADVEESARLDDKHADEQNEIDRNSGFVHLAFVSCHGRGGPQQHQGTREHKHHYGSEDAHHGRRKKGLVLQGVEVFFGGKEPGTEKVEDSGDEGYDVEVPGVLIRVGFICFSRQARVHCERINLARSLVVLVRQHHRHVVDEEVDDSV